MKFVRALLVAVTLGAAAVQVAPASPAPAQQQEALAWCGGCWWFIGYN